MLEGQNQQPAMQPESDKAADKQRDLKRKGTGIITNNVSYRKKIVIAIAFIIICVFILSIVVSTILPLIIQQGQAKSTADIIYDELGVDSLVDFIVIKGNEEEGYYYDFAEGADEKLDAVVKKISKQGKKIDRNLLEKMIKAEVVNSFPFLEGGKAFIGQGGNAASYTGSTIAEKIWNFLRGQGYSEYTVAGIMGNMMQESSMNPSSVSRTGTYVGLVQWGGGRRTQLEQYAASVGKSWNDLDVQLDFLYAEMQPDGGGIATYQLEGQGSAPIAGISYSANDILNATSVQMASDAFQCRFERYGGEYTQRRAYAEQFYNTYKGTQVQKPSTSQNSIYSEVPHLYMADYNIPFNKGGNVSSNGCGFVAITMVLQYITGEEITVEEVVNWGQDKYYNGEGAEGTLFAAAVKNWDAGEVQCVGKGATDEIKAALEENIPVIAYMGSGNFTTGGHFIVLTGIDENNQVTVNDPGSRDRSNVKWDFDLIINEAQSGGAFWIFEAGESIAKGEFQGTVRIRRVTPNKNIGEVKNTGVRASISTQISSEGLGYKQEIPEEIRQQMEGVSMQHLSGVTYDDLSYLTIPYYDFEGNVQEGHMIVNAKLADEVLLIFQELYSINYPIERMELIDNFSGPNHLIGADLDYASIEENNTSAFNDRVTVDVNSIGTTPSLHATGQAIDINPQINPYITADRTSAHPNAQKYNTNRDTKEGWTDIEKAACITMDSQIYQIFTKYGWKWLGNENNTGDTQHFYKDDLSNVATIDTSQISNNATTSAGSDNDIENYINNNATSGTWSVYAKNLADDSVKVNINNSKLESASLIKLFIMATAYEEIEKGTLNKSDVINDIKIMINRSDNVAANRMIDRLGFDKINNYINKHNYSSTEINRKMLQSTGDGDNYTSVVDVGNLLESMYKGTCVSANASSEMIDILKTQTLTSKIPAGVPNGVVTANKTGELDDVENDAAIVYKDGAPYVIVVMSNNVTDTAKARSNIKDISSKIYNSISTSANAPHKVAIVAGHGIPSRAGSYEDIANRTKSYTTGTAGKTPSGETWNEWEITKKVADYVEKYLSSYSNEVAVVQVGYSEPNWERMQLAKDEGVDSYVGIHFNSSENTSATGVMAYYRNGDSESNSFADIIARNVADNMDLTYNGIESDASSNNGVLDSIGNSSEWGFPSTLVEGGFMSNPSDMEIIGAEDEEGLKRYAQGIAAGILEYYGIENRGFDGTVTLSSVSTTSNGINSRIFDLKYVSPETFEEYVSNNNTQALNVFTLDEETKKLIVANWSYSTSEGVKITKSKPINFRSVLNKYTLPIEYQIDMLVHSDDPEMVGKLADLAIDSEYIIAVQDNVTTIETTQDYQEKNYTRTLVIDEYRISDPVDWHSVSKTIEVEERVANEIELTYADSWFVRFSKTSSYASSSFNHTAGNNLIADQGEYIGDFKTTVYCSACNTPPGTPITAAGVDATPNHTIAVHTEYFTGQAVGGKMANGSQVIINGTVYTVEDTGDLSRHNPDNWIDIYTEVDCVTDYLYLDSGSGTVPVYVAENVREASAETDEEGEEETDAEYNNLKLKGISTTTNVAGTVTDGTVVVQETLPTEYERLSRSRTYVTENRKITTVRTITNKYDSGKENVESKEDEFIDIFLSSKGITNRFDMGWMARLLEQSERTVNMIDLTKYLYQKALEREQEIEDSELEYSFNEYKYNDLYHIYESADILEEYIKAQENNALRLYMNDHLSIDEGEVDEYVVPATKDDEEVKYKLITNEEGGKGFGYNIYHYINETDLNTGNGYEDRIVEHYKELGIENIADYVNNDDTIDSSTVDKVMRMEIQKWRDIVVESLQNNGLELEENQINALTAVAYEYGWSNEDAVSFKSAYNNYYLNGNVEGFRTQFYIADHTVRPFYVSDIEPSSELARKTQIKAELNWNLFDTGQYRTPDGEILDPDSFKGIISGEFLEVAQAVWQMVCDVDPEYSMAYGKMVPPAENFSVVDCSHYVSWVLYEYGVATNNDELVKTFEGGQHSTETLMTVNWDALGFELIPVSSMPGGLAANVQPGDILIKDGHTDIAVEYVDGTLWTYDCGNVYNWRGSNGEPVAKNYMLNQTHTVIRLKK